MTGLRERKAYHSHYGLFTLTMDFSQWNMLLDWEPFKGKKYLVFIIVLLAYHLI